METLLHARDKVAPRVLPPPTCHPGPCQGADGGVAPGCTAVWLASALGFRGRCPGYAFLQAEGVPFSGGPPMVHCARALRPEPSAQSS